MRQELNLAFTCLGCRSKYSHWHRLWKKKRLRRLFKQLTAFNSWCSGLQASSTYHIISLFRSSQVSRPRRHLGGRIRGSGFDIQQLAKRKIEKGSSRWNRDWGNVASTCGEDFSWSRTDIKETGFKLFICWELWFWIRLLGPRWSNGRGTNEQTNAKHENLKVWKYLYKRSCPTAAWTRDGNWLESCTGVPRFYDDSAGWLAPGASVDRTKPPRNAQL